MDSMSKWVTESFVLPTQIMPRAMAVMPITWRNGWGVGLRGGEELRAGGVPALVVLFAIVVMYRYKPQWEL